MKIFDFTMDIFNPDEDTDLKSGDELYNIFINEVEDKYKKFTINKYGDNGNILEYLLWEFCHGYCNSPNHKIFYDKLMKYNPELTEKKLQNY